jgi:hypothetical protein
VVAVEGFVEFEMSAMGSEKAVQDPDTVNGPLAPGHGGRVVAEPVQKDLGQLGKLAGCGRADIIIGVHHENKVITGRVPRVQFGMEVSVKCVKGFVCVTAGKEHDRLLVVGGARLPVVANWAVGSDDAETFLLATSVPGGGPAAERVSLRRLNTVACLVNGEHQRATPLMRGG